MQLRGEHGRVSAGERRAPNPFRPSDEIITMSGAPLSRQSSLLCDEDALSRVTLALPTLLDGTFHLEARKARRFKQDLRSVFADKNANLFGVIEDALKGFCKETKTDKSMTKARTPHAHNNQEIDPTAQARAHADHASSFALLFLSQGTFLRNVKVLAERCEYDVDGLSETASEIYDESRRQLISPGKRKRDDDGRAGSYDSTMALFSLEAAASDMSYGFPTGIF